MICYIISLTFKLSLNQQHCRGQFLSFVGKRGMFHISRDKNEQKCMRITWMNYKQWIIRIKLFQKSANQPFIYMKTDKSGKQSYFVYKYWCSEWAMETGAEYAKDWRFKVLNLQLMFLTLPCLSLFNMDLVWLL